MYTIRNNRLSKTNLVLYALGVLPVVWLGVLIAPSLHGGLQEIIEGLSKAMAKPFSLVWCDTTAKTVLILLGAYVLAILIYVTSQRNYRPREEHGSAKWGKTAQLRKYRNKEKPEDAKILTQDTSISLKGRSHRHNLNVVVVGGSGAGKTRFYAKPNVLQANCSMVILDPNGVPASSVGAQTNAAISMTVLSRNMPDVFRGFSGLKITVAGLTERSHPNPA